MIGLGLPVAAPLPVASAVRPPAIDDSMLPPAAQPKPPEPTEKQSDCTAATFDRRLNPTATQLTAFDLPALWALSTGQGQKVAVIDTGVATHPQLPRLIAGGDYVSTGDGLEDCDAHGTLVAGIIAATADSGGFAGIAPGVSVITIRQSSIKYGPVHGRPFGVGNVDTLAMAVRTAADMGATVINISSVACTVGAALRDRALGAAVAYAVDVKDAVIVVAAGNVGPGGNCPQQNPPPDPARRPEPDWDTADIAVSPGWYDDYVLTVGSVSADGSASSFSLAGPWVDVAAPGEAVVSLNPGHTGVANSYRSGSGSAISGTSYAAPVVSGLAALIRARFPDLPARQVMQRIETTAHRPPDGWNPYVGSGLVDPLAALSNGAPSASPSWSQRPVAPSVPPPPPDTSGRFTAFTGVAGCAAFLAAGLALMAPVNRLARRRRSAGQRDSARVGSDTVVRD
ncbi:MAG TPA: type VII secretion-associated serine protease mycosin [Mycobacterium sp.]|nr:type VII secretion-associated serine protease mycosin [Mycobacterium sp.]